MKCQQCGNEVRSHERHCAVCDADVGYPNVRCALGAEEVSALAQRVAEAQRSCAARECTDILVAFAAAVRMSKAVLGRSLQQVLQLVSSDNELYATFYAQVDAHARRPEETLMERDRLLADDLLFPHFREEIRFAALSLDGNSVRHYGACSLVLSELAIQHRATVFEKNSVLFCRERRLGVENGIPPGYRAVWDAREQLASAKLHHRLAPGLEPAAFPRILLSEGTNGAEPDFVEVHIHGPLHRRAIEQIVIRGTSRSSDEALLLEIERRAEEFHTEVVRADAS